MRLFPNLSFNGQCEAAFQLYEQCLSGKILYRLTYENTPMQTPVPPDWKQKISHATFSFGEFVIYGSDALPGQYQKPQGFALQLDLSDPEQAESIYRSLAEGGTVRMPLQETFWALRFAVLTDRFGIPWLINCEQPK